MTKHEEMQKLGLECLGFALKRKDERAVVAIMMALATMPEPTTANQRDKGER